MEKQFISIITRSQSTKVYQDDILMIRQQNRKVTVVTDDGEYEFYAKMKEVCALLHSRFFLCSQGLVVNFDNVVRIADCTIRFANDVFIQVSREVFFRTRKAFNLYLREMEGQGRTKDDSEISKDRKKKK